MDGIKNEIGELLKSFQISVLELTDKKESEKDNLSTDDINSIDYVLGMISISSANLEMLLSQDEVFYKTKGDLIVSFLENVSSFSDKLNVEGFGLIS